MLRPSNQRTKKSIKKNIIIAVGGSVPNVDFKAFQAILAKYLFTLSELKVDLMLKSFFRRKNERKKKEGGGVLLYLFKLSVPLRCTFFFPDWVQIVKVEKVLREEARGQIFSTNVQKKRKLFREKKGFLDFFSSQIRILNALLYLYQE